MADNRIQQLRSLAGAVPGLNRQAQKQARAASQVALQQKLGAAPKQAATPAVAQGLAAQQAGVRGQIAQAGQAQAQQQLTQLGQQGLQAQQARNEEALRGQQMAQQERLAGEKQRSQQRLSDAEIATRKQITESDIESARRIQSAGLAYDNRLSFLSAKQKKDLSRIGGDVKQQILDSRLAFDRDERGRKFNNERQLADYLAANARDEIEFQERMQMTMQAHKKKMQVLEVAFKDIERQLRQEMQTSEAEKNYEHQVELAAMKAALENEIQREENAAKNRGAIWNAASSMAGQAGQAIASAGGIFG